MDYQSRHEWLYEYIKTHTSSNKFEEVCDVVYNLILNNDISYVQKKLNGYVNDYQKLDNIKNVSIFFVSNIESMPELTAHTKYQDQFLSYKLPCLNKDLFENEEFLEKMCEFIEESKPTNPTITYGKIMMYMKVKGNIINIFDEVKALPTNFDFYLHYDLPVELIDKIKNINNDVIASYKNSNQEIINYKKELIENGYSEEILKHDGMIFSDEINVGYMPYIIQQELWMSFGDDIVMNNHCLESFLFPDHCDELNEFSDKYGMNNLKSSFYIEKHENREINYDQKKILTLNMCNSYDAIKNACKDKKIDACYSDVNRKRLCQMAYTNNGCILEAKLNGVKYGTIEIVYSKKGLIIMPPHHDNNVIIKRENFNLIDICAKALSRMTKNNIYVYGDSSLISGLSIASNQALDMSTDVLNLKNVNLYYDIYGEQNIHLIDSHKPNIIDSIMFVQDQTIKLKEKINKFIPKDHSLLKYRKSIMAYIDQFVKDEIDPISYMKSNYDNAISNGILSALALSLFEIKRINNSDATIIKEIYRLECENFEDIVFKFDNIEGFVLWSPIHNKVFGYIVTERKKDYLMIHSVLVAKQFRHYGFVTQLYGYASKYYVEHEQINKVKFYLPFTPKSDLIVRLFCDILFKVTNIVFDYKILKVIDLQNDKDDKDIKYMIYKTSLIL